jgi:pimeloyl-ACP methyl ester carboxylesterase
MFEPFPGNYVWNLSANIALSLGAAIGEIDTANRQVLADAKQGEDGGTEAFLRAWGSLSERVGALAEEDVAAGRLLSASEKYRRASIYLMTAERMQSRHYAPRMQTYQRMLTVMDRAVETGRLNCEKVAIPYGESSFPGLLIRGDGDGPRPCMVFCNGLDSVKEMIYWSASGQELARRGISTLMIDQPGVGAALRLQGLRGIHDSERWAGAALDLLETRTDVRHDRIGIIGWSLGGYFAPRAAAFEKRIKLCVAWGANHNWGEMQRRRLEREGERPVPHYWDHVMWVFGKDTMDEFMAFAPSMSLAGIIQQIEVPFLITHGSHDRQIPLEYARQSYDEAVNSPKRQLRIFTDREGGVEHCSADNMEPVRSFICDWIGESFADMN